MDQQAEIVQVSDLEDLSVPVLHYAKVVNKDKIKCVPYEAKDLNKIELRHYSKSFIQLTLHKLPLFNFRFSLHREQMF